MQKLVERRLPSLKMRNHLRIIVAARVIKEVNVKILLRGGTGDKGTSRIFEAVGGPGVGGEEVEQGGDGAG